MNAVVEYRVRPVVRHIVTKHVTGPNEGGCSVVAEFDNENMANVVRSSLEASESLSKRVGSVDECHAMGINHELLNALEQLDGDDFRLFRVQSDSDSMGRVWYVSTFKEAGRVVDSLQKQGVKDWSIQVRWDNAYREVTSFMGSSNSSEERARKEELLAVLNESMRRKDALQP